MTKEKSDFIDFNIKCYECSECGEIHYRSPIVADDKWLCGFCYRIYIINDRRF